MEVCACSKIERIPPNSSPLGEQSRRGGGGTPPGSGSRSEATGGTGPAGGRSRSPQGAQQRPEETEWEGPRLVGSRTLSTEATGYGFPCPSSYKFTRHIQSDPDVLTVSTDLLICWLGFPASSSLLRRPPDAGLC